MILPSSRLMRQAVCTGAVAVLVFMLLVSGSVEALSRGYKTNDTSIEAGMVVSLTSDSTTDQIVERSSQSTQNRAVGVVTTSDNSPVTLASSGMDILVETEGEALTYVSDLNGSVKQGDLLVLSPLKGILMKSTEGSTSIIIGIAAEDSPDKDQSTEYQVDENGTKKTTHISKIKVNLNRLGTASTGDGEKSTLEKLGRSIVGKDVSAIRVFLALLLFIVVLIAEGGIIYGAVSSAVIALGRNPMAQKLIKRELMQIMLVALGVLALGLGAVYCVLWL